MNARVKCPTCEQPVEWTPESKWRPFCSERCKMLDLGDWFEESNKIAEHSWSEQPDGRPWVEGLAPPNDDDY